jgi:hypothetical protein
MVLMRYISTIHREQQTCAGAKPGATFLVSGGHLGAALGLLASWQARPMAWVTRIGVTGSSRMTSTYE